MAHRGRLNVLSSVMGKSYEFIFREFSENFVPEGAHGSGGVKYHLGYESVRTTTSGQQVVIHLSPNPSHLEAVNGVVEGKARARQRLRGDRGAPSAFLPHSGSRRRCHGRTGSGGGSFQLFQAPWLSDRRDRAHRGQQPDRFYHGSDRQRVRVCIVRTLPRPLKLRSFTSMVMIPYPWQWSPKRPLPIGRNSGKAW